ncbi:globin [Sphingomonas colocasiae]|uniref:Globin n=1 Tax=Sphingomonas colocasiae TaxID=1848973 RepID=A0ABS7PPG1_9SPHN|nr:globin [Sphingomonas colocasiae]MBY8822332.1 globin [Sphingomonas colocasiae]
MADPAPILPYEAIGGAPAVSAIVSRFYALMDEETDYAPLRAMHAADLGPVAEGLEQFLTAWLGGPSQAWMARNACVMSLHRGLAVTPAIAGQWVQAMARAVAAQPGIDPRLGEAMVARLAQMAHAMISRPASQPAPDML